MDTLEEAEEQVLLAIEHTASIVDALSAVDGSRAVTVVAESGALSRVVTRARELISASIDASPPLHPPELRNDSYAAARRLDVAIQKASYLQHALGAAVTASVTSGAPLPIVTEGDVEAVANICGVAFALPDKRVGGEPRKSVLAAGGDDDDKMEEDAGEGGSLSNDSSDDSDEFVDLDAAADALWDVAAIAPPPAESLGAPDAAAAMNGDE